MGTPPRVIPSTAKPAAEDDEFKPIPLTVSPILSKDGPIGATITSDLSNFDLRNLPHRDCECCYALSGNSSQSIAGITSNGSLIFGINCRHNGRNHTAIGGFDPSGKPIPLSPKDKDLIFKRLPSAGGVVELGKKGDTAVGIKTKTNPSAGVYADLKDKKIMFDFGGNFGSNPNFRLNSTTTFDSKLRFEKVNANAVATSGPWTGKADWTTGKDGKHDRKFDLSYTRKRRNTTLIVTASYLPDNKVANPLPIPVGGKPPEFKDPSKARLTFTLKF